MRGLLVDPLPILIHKYLCFTIYLVAVLLSQWYIATVATFSFLSELMVQWGGFLENQ